ncbi:DUF2630 family protein [Solihabitans fulvus]|uniref:DUF2630 family protein n=1 Tax=Solihabitans fulvus TaxID=1892852 RepID=UPI001CB76615|nr:DUF2630 family protein [Solihabitans fulvus]
MREHEVLGRIRELVDEEHSLRQRTMAGELDSGEERQRLAHLEESLDQCWDMLRQRRALRVAGGDPDQASARPVNEVEGYLQ